MAKFLLVLFALLHFPLKNVKSQELDLSHLIDSIDTQNLYAHDTIKIKNYIFIYEKLDGLYNDTALYFIEKALKIDSLNKNHDYSVRLRISKAQIFTNKHEYSKALSLYKNTIKVDNISKLEIIEIYNKIGLLYFDLNMINEAFSNLMTGIQLCDKKQYPVLYSMILINLGNYHERRLDFNKSLKYYNEALTIQYNVNDKEGIARSFNNIGTIYFRMQKFDSVLVYFNKALDMYELINNKTEQAIPFFNIGETYYEMGDKEKAILYIKKSYEIEKTYNNKFGMAIALSYLGKIYAEMGHSQYGLNLLNQALSIFKEINNKFEIKEVYYNISSIYEKLKQSDKALSYFKLFTQVKDSIFDMESNKRLLELETKYLSEQQQSEIRVQKLKLEQQQTQISQQNIQKIYILGGFFILLVFSIIVYRSYHVQNKSNTLLVEQKEQIEQQNIKITSSIQYAKLIQTAALPPHDLLKSVFNQHFVLYLPRDIVSGDFFWATHKNGYSVVACADCTGHGVPGAFMSMLGVSFLTEIVNRSETIQANLILENLRQNIIDSLHQTGKIGESRDGMDIALCIVNHERTELEYSGAFIPLVIVRDNNIIQISADKMPIGVHDDILQPFTSHKVKLLKGDMIYLFSDGYADQFGGPFNKKFKVQPFLSLLLAQHNKPLIQQREILYDTILSWRGENEQIDDILVMGFRV